MIWRRQGDEECKMKKRGVIRSAERRDGSQTEIRSQEGKRVLLWGRDPPCRAQGRLPKITENADNLNQRVIIDPRQYRGRGKACGPGGMVARCNP
jgi:hypothetical protein